MIDGIFYSLDDLHHDRLFTLGERKVNVAVLANFRVETLVRFRLITHIQYF